MDKLALALDQCYRLLNPGAVVLVSVGDARSDNLFPVTWNMPLRKDPPMAALLSGKRHHSWPFIERTGELVLNVPGEDLVDAVYGCGTVSGRTGIDKWERFGLTRERAAKVKVPLVAEAVGNLECRVAQVVDMGSSALVIAQVVAARAAPARYADGAWVAGEAPELLHHLGGRHFGVTSRRIEAALPKR